MIGNGYLATRISMEVEEGNFYDFCIAELDFRVAEQTSAAK